MKEKITLPAGWVRVRPSRAKIGDRYTYMEPDPRDVPDAWFSRPIDWGRINERHELPMPAGDGIVIARRVSTPHTDAIRFILSGGRKKPAKAKHAGKPVKALKIWRDAARGACDPERIKLGVNTHRVFVLPADAASVERMVEQVSGTLEPYAKFPEVAARAVLASIGIKA